MRDKPVSNPVSCILVCALCGTGPGEFPEFRGKVGLSSGNNFAFLFLFGGSCAISPLLYSPSTLYLLYHTYGTSCLWDIFWWEVRSVGAEHHFQGGRSTNHCPTLLSPVSTFSLLYSPPAAHIHTNAPLHIFPNGIIHKCNTKLSFSRPVSRVRCVSVRSTPPPPTIPPLKTSKQQRYYWSALSGCGAQVSPIGDAASLGLDGRGGGRGRRGADCARHQLVAGEVVARVPERVRVRTRMEGTSLCGGRCLASYRTDRPVKDGTPG